MTLGLKVDIFTLPFIALVSVLLVLRVPRDPALAKGRPSPSLTVLVAVAALPLVIYALSQAELQRIDISSEHAEFNHWVEVSFYAIAVLLLGLVAALRPNAYRLTAWSAGLGLAILGGGHPWRMGTTRRPPLTVRGPGPRSWGGLVFVAVAEWERLRSPFSGA